MSALRPLMVMLLAGVCVVHAQERVKICGRELIRLAISLCGNSRLRRSIPASASASGLGSGLASSPTISHHHKEEKQQQQQQQAIEQQRQTPAETFPASPLYHGDTEARSGPPRPRRSPTPSRVRRASGQISDVCCEKGCSMKELVQFC